MSNQIDLPILVATIPKGSREQVRILVDEFAGQIGVNIRIFWSDGSQWHPTRKGVRVGLAKLAAVCDALKEAENVVATMAPDRDD